MIGNLTLAYSKDTKFGKPVTTTRLAPVQPCLNPKERNKGANQTFWMGELDVGITGWAGCTS